MLVVNLLGTRPAYVANMALTLIITLLTAKGTGWSLRRRSACC